MDYVKSKSRSTIQGFLVVLAALLTLSIGMVGLAGCSGGTSDEDAIRASLASELDSIKNIDDAFVNEFSESIDMSQLSVYGIDGVEFMKSLPERLRLRDRLDQCRRRQRHGPDHPYLQELYRLPAGAADGRGRGHRRSRCSCRSLQRRDQQKIGEIVIGSLDGVELAATQPITITYTKVDGTWGAGLVHLGRHRGPR